MAKTVRARVKPALLQWARRTAGYTEAEAAKRAGVSEDRLAAWELGELSPTIRQLQTLADAYKRPLSVFYLADVPRDFQPMRDFRRLPGVETTRFTPELALEVRLAQQRRQLALDLLHEFDEDARFFDLTATIDDDVEGVAEKIRAELDVTPFDRVEWKADRDGYAAFNGLRSRLEDRGVLVFQTNRVSANEISGFAIAERPLPTIVVTRSNTPATRRSFSLVHELVHIMLRQSGVSDIDIDDQVAAPIRRVEMFCNQVAAATLIPREDLLSERAVRDQHARSTAWTDETIRDLARTYSVSREAIVRRLLTFGLTTEAFYQSKRASYVQEFLKRKAARDQAEPREFSTNPPRDAVTRLGKPLVQMILNSYHQDRMSLSEVSGYLGIRTRHVPKVEMFVR
jgi:Zn-dependent peptidase ImmA (M78 family)/DNA-binding XRE family transcriptional regulator